MGTDFTTLTAEQAGELLDEITHVAAGRISLDSEEECRFYLQFLLFLLTKMHNEMQSYIVGHKLDEVLRNARTSAVH